MRAVSVFSSKTVHTKKKIFSCHVTLCSPPPPRPQACLVYFNISSVQKGQRLGRISASDTLRIKPVLAPAITFASLHSSWEPFVIALASLSSSCGRKRINRPELSALDQFFSLPARHECETRRAGRDRSAGSSARWEVTGERSRCTAEWRRDVNPGTSMTYGSRLWRQGERGRKAEQSRQSGCNLQPSVKQQDFDRISNASIRLSAF